MLRQFLPIESAIYHAKTEFQTFGFGDMSTPPKVLPNKIQYQMPGENDKNLCLAAVAGIDGTRLLRTGPIDSSYRMQELNELLSYLRNEPTIKIPNRLSLIQFASTDNDLEQIRLQRYLLSKYPYNKESVIPIAHLNFPFELFSYSRTNMPPVIINSPTFNKLSRLHNIEGWLHYSQWIHEEYISLIQSIALTDTLKFSLEGSLRDFSHEMTSPLLNDCRQQLEALTLVLGNHEFAKWESEEPISRAQISEEQIQIFELYIELCTYLKTQDELLKVINSRIGEIQPFQPQLQPVQAIAQIYKELLDTQTDLSGAPKSSLGKQLMLTTLLNYLLDVTSILTCDTGLKRTSICFSISLAILQLLRSESLTDMVKLAVEWDTGVLDVNQWISQQGHEAFVDWLRHPAESGDLYQPARLTTKLRLHVFKNLQTFTTPLLPEEVDGGANYKELIISREYLNFLPDRFVEYNDKTGQPVAAKAEALATLAQVNPVV